MRITRKIWLFGAVLPALVLSVLGWRLGWFGPRGGEAALLAEKPYRILEEHEPEAWARVLAAHERIGEDPARRAEFINLANAEFSAAATRRLARATPEAQLALMRDMVANLKHLHSRLGDACFRYLYPEIGGGADVARDLDAESQARTLELTAEVIRSAAETPAPPVSPELAGEKLAPIIDAVYAEFGADTQMIAHAREPGVDRVKVCGIAISLYQRILALPPAEASRVLSVVSAAG